MNALAHCAEALYATGANPITSLMAEEGIRVLSSGLPRVITTPDDLDARGDVLAGAYLAAAAFAAAGSGIHHKICHVLGGAYDLPHAEMHTVILPHALALVAPSEPGAMARIGTAIGDPDVPAAVYGLAVSLGSPTSLRAIGMPPDRLDEAAGLIVDAIPGTPKPFDIPAIRALLADAFEGRRPSLDRVVEPSTPR
jgi:alcohol dehydrogenase class IV